MKRYVFVCLALLMSLTCLLTACLPGTPREPLSVEHTTWNMFAKLVENGDMPAGNYQEYETTVHLFTTNKEGPNFVIEGGTHGDEIAGWTAALQLVEQLEEEEGLCGNFLIIPQGNIAGDRLKMRYPGYANRNRPVYFQYGDYEAKEYSDVNRSFPVKQQTVTTYSETVATGLRKTIENFIKEFGGADYIIDMHEARYSWTDNQGQSMSVSLGDSLIGDNDPFFMYDLILRYNSEYRPEDEPLFELEPVTQAGSFSLYFTTTCPDTVVYTIETNRLWYDDADHIPLETRVRQQLNILRATFDLAWGMA